jgi:hypothetical protein
MNTVEFGLQVRLVRGMYDSGEYEIAHVHLDRLAWDVLEMVAAGEDAQRLRRRSPWSSSTGLR